jgi:hypothetical protein
MVVVRITSFLTLWALRSRTGNDCLDTLLNTNSAIPSAIANGNSEHKLTISASAPVLPRLHIQACAAVTSTNNVTVRVVAGQ